MKRVKKFVLSSHVIAVISGIILAVVVAMVFLFTTDKIFVINEIETPVLVDETENKLTTQGPVLERSLPTRIRIPEISLDTTFVEPLGLETNGEVAVQKSFTEVGWYKYGPTPGEIGPAVVLGHVDSFEGPAIFFSLGQLEEGDDVFIDREDGSTAHFKVVSMERPSQADFPTARVYGDIDHAGLRLITCTGVYLQGTQRYTHNLVVYARLVE